MIIAEWHVPRGRPLVDREERRVWVRQVVRDADLASDACYREIARALCAVWSRRIDRKVDVRFVQLPPGGYTGATAQLTSGDLVVFCVSSPRWFFRLQVLCHEFAHFLLGHGHAELDRREGLQRLLPHLQPKVMWIIAGRTNFSRSEEAEAEGLADELLAELTAHQRPAYVE